MILNKYYYCNSEYRIFNDGNNVIEDITHKNIFLY